MGKYLLRDVYVSMVFCSGIYRCDGYMYIVVLLYMHCKSGKYSSTCIIQLYRTGNSTDAMVKSSFPPNMRKR